MARFYKRRKGYRRRYRQRNGGAFQWASFGHFCLPRVNRTVRR